MDIREKPFWLNEKQEEWVRETAEKMSLEEKLGQLFCVLGDAYGAEELRTLVRDYHIGGVLFRPAPKKVNRERYRELSAYAKFPLLKAANLEEGGAGVLTDGTYFGSQMQVAATGDPECTRQFAKVCAVEGKAVGVNWTFSPVVDVDYNFRNPITNVRTFGNDPDTVLQNASVFVNEIQKYGLAASCKHFPGDGVDYRDQHLHPTYNDLSAEEWYGSYGRIYRTLVDAGVLSIMAGHIVQPNVIRAVNPEASIEEELPASQSREMLTGVLREQFGFNGVIITDATIMGGYTMTMPRSRAIPVTIQAGCDMLCFTTDIYEDLQYLREGLDKGLLTEERLNEAVVRILALKAKVASEPEDKETEEIPAEEWSSRCADKAITLVKDIQSLVPVDAGRFPKVRLVILGEDSMQDGSMRETAAKVFQEYGFETEFYEPLEDELHGSSKLPEDQLTLILANCPTASNNTTVRICWCPKHALEIPRYINEEKTAFISFANPYHLQDVPRVRTYINAYAATAVTVRLAIEKLIGKSKFQGVSPTDAFCGLRDTRY